MLTPQEGSPCAAPWPASGSETDRLLSLLGGGELTLAGLIPWSSNYTFLGEVSRGDESAPVVYKPIRGEQPLFDFPRNTLAKREVAAFVVSRALGWDLVPPTVLRTGPHGRGSVQIFVNVDQDAHFFTFRDDPAFSHVLQALASSILSPTTPTARADIVCAPGTRASSPSTMGYASMSTTSCGR